MASPSRRNHRQRLLVGEHGRMRRRQLLIKLRAGVCSGPFCVGPRGAQSRSCRPARMMTEDNTDVRSPVAIRRWEEVVVSDRLNEQLDSIFFEASGTKTFADD